MGELIRIWKEGASPEIILQQQLYDHSLGLHPGQHGGLDQLPAFGWASPSPGFNELQRSHLLIHGCCQLQDLHHLPGVLGDVRCGDIYSKDLVSMDSEARDHITSSHHPHL